MESSIFELDFLIMEGAVLFIIGVLLSFLAREKKGEDESNELVTRLENALPGAQCAQCGYPGCRAYAQALADGETTCNKCPPGGQDTVDNLAAILGIAPPQDGNNEDMIFAPRTVAIIHGSLCTGCTKCKRICPVDAITGSPRHVHEVIEEECIGCNECVKCCPESCIELVRLEANLSNYNWDLNSHQIHFVQQGKN